MFLNREYLNRVARSSSMDSQYRQNQVLNENRTIFSSNYSAENTPIQNQTFIKRELQASLYNGSGNTRNGILGIVLPEMMDKIYTGPYICSTCGKTHTGVAINDSTTIKEFSQNCSKNSGKGDICKKRIRGKIWRSFA